jgi:hypothetical protein
MMQAVKQNWILWTGTLTEHKAATDSTIILLSNINWFHFSHCMKFLTGNELHIIPCLSIVFCVTCYCQCKQHNCVHFVFWDHKFPPISEHMTITKVLKCVSLRKAVKQLSQYLLSTRLLYTKYSLQYTELNWRTVTAQHNAIAVTLHSTTL